MNLPAACPALVSRYVALPRYLESCWANVKFVDPKGLSATTIDGSWGCPHPVSKEDDLGLCAEHIKEFRDG